MANVLEHVGEKTIEHLDYVGSLNIQLWATIKAMARALPFVGNRYRWQATVRQMLEIGVDAMPMVSLMAICSGFILAMQGASELRRFGALHYVIDLVAVGFTRELGPLLTAIAVSGRSGSAFAAEIGTMKVTEELDSLRVMALEPVEFVLAPKYLAALISVPCLSIIANLFGILAGGLFYDGRPDAGYMLSGRLEKLDELDYEGRVKIEIALSAQMTNIATGATVWSNAVSEVGDANKRDVPAVVSEMNGAMERAIKELLSSMPVDMANSPVAAKKN